MLECRHCGCRCAEENRDKIRRCVTSDGVHDFATVESPKEAVHHPQHYGGGDNPYEAIKVIDAWQLGFCLGNTVKYIARAGKKDTDHELQDLKKALWYLTHQIELVEKGDKSHDIG